MSSPDLFIREQGCASVPDYRRRVFRLAAFYLGIAVCGIGAMILVIAQGKLYITLAQRSNVETLTLAVVLLLFAVLTFLSLPGAWGAGKIVWFNFSYLWQNDPIAIEQRKQKAVRFNNGDPHAVHLNVIVRRASSRENAESVIEIPLSDDAGHLGDIRICGTSIEHHDGPDHSSNSILAFFKQRIKQLVRQRDPLAKVEIVQWETIDSEASLAYASLTTFAQNLARQLQLPPLWPEITLSEEDLLSLKADARALCPTIRDEAHLPDVEYEATHTLPLIPEPLAFASLSRSERRADPVFSMGCAFLVVITILVLLILFLIFPPWVPGK